MPLFTKKIDLLIHSNFAPTNVGGVESVVRGIGSAVEAKMPEGSVVYFYGVKPDSEAALLENHIAKRILLSVKGLHFLAWGNLSLLVAGLRSKKILFNDPYPTLWPALFLLKIMGKNLHLFYHATPKLPSFASKIYPALRNLLYRGTDAIVTSPQLKQELPRSCRVLIAPLWVDDVFETTALSETLPSRYLLFIGRLSSYKGVEVVAKAITANPDIAFVVVGKGEKEHLIKALSDYPQVSNLTFVNRFVSEGEKNDLIAKADALLFPSTNTGEAFGIIQLEALRAGTPIINTDLGTGVNFVGRDGQNALTIAPGNDHELNMAVQRLWQDDMLRDRMSKSAEALYQAEFAGDKSLKSILKFLDT